MCIKYIKSKINCQSRVANTQIISLINVLRILRKVIEGKFIKIIVWLKSIKIVSTLHMELQTNTTL